MRHRARHLHHEPGRSSHAAEVLRCSKTKIAPVLANASCFDDVVAGTPPPTATITRTPTATRTPTPPALDAAFVSQSVPSSMTAGQQYSVSVRMRNLGTMTWTAAASVRLGAINPNDNSTWGANRVLLAGGDSIAPGQEKLFTWTVTAPSSPGTYNFQWRMLREGVVWFGANSTNVSVSVGAAPTATRTRTPVGIPPPNTPTATATHVQSGPPDASFVSQSVPSAMIAGQQYSVSVTMRNDGGTTWTAGGLFRLGAINPYDNFNWGMNRVALAGGDSIAPNQQKTFTWTITAPSGSGTYHFQWRMVQDGVAWFGDNSADAAVTVSGGGVPDAAYVSKSVPTTMSAGQQYSVSITMRNTGGTNWTAGNLYRLGAINPYDNFTWGMNRTALAGGDTIGPNQQKTFTWTVQAPSTPGTYNFQWRMVQDGVAWFGDNSANAVISVQ